MNINSFAVVIKKAPPVTKASLKEFLLELVVDADLVSHEINSYCLFLKFFQPFHFVERTSLQRTLCYLNPKLGTNDIPKHTSIRNAVMEKVAKLDEIDREIIDVSL